MAAHSNVVGGSTAKRVINCPGSVALVQKMPPQPPSVHADTGTLLHNTIATILEGDKSPEEFLGATYNGIELTEDLMERKLLPALMALDEIDPDKEMEYAVEQVVGFGNLLPGVFGSADLVGRLGDRAVLLDWKFGDGVAVEAVENPQGLFYCAAALHTAATKWAFAGAKEVEIIIVQPPLVKRWVTTIERVKQFEADLILAVRAAEQPDAPLKAGDHCRWCRAKAVCPEVTGAVARANRTALRTINVDQMADLLDQARTLETWIDDLRGLAQRMIEDGVEVPGWKVVPKRATRKWTDDKQALTALAEAGLTVEQMTDTSIKSPAQMEKVLKKHNIPMPDDLVVAVSTGNTLAPADDPRPAVLNIGKQLSNALGKLV